MIIGCGCGVFGGGVGVGVDGGSEVMQGAGNGVGLQVEGKLLRAGGGLAL